MFTANTLYNLLPRFYHLKEGNRSNDELRALFEVLAREIGVVENDIQRLYDNAFIETCDNWAIPYIGDLLGVEAQHDLSTAAFNARARVANTIAYRRRKGTLSMLAQFAADSSGWKVHAVEFMHRLATSQHLNHVRNQAHSTASVGQMSADSVGAAFDPSPRTVDIRAIDRRRVAVPNIMNVGLLLWRIGAFPLEMVRAAAAGDGCDGNHFYLDPLGREMRLFNHPAPSGIKPEAAPEIGVPEPLRRRPLARELEFLKTGQASGHYFGKRNPASDAADPEKPEPVVAIYLDGSPVPPAQIAISDLSKWKPPAADCRVNLDPVLGRLTLRHPEDDTTQVHTSYSYGFSDTIGACPTGRQTAADAFSSADQDLNWLLEVNQTRTEVPGQRVSRLKAAIGAWNLMPAGTRGALLITDSERYSEDLSAHPLKLAAGSRLLIVAADAAADIEPGMSAVERPWTAQLTRPCILGSLRVEGAAGDESGGTLALNGLLIEGDVTLTVGHLERFQVDHCTLSGLQSGRLKIAAGKYCRVIEIHATRLNALQLEDSATRVSIGDSLLEADGTCIAAPRGDLNLSHCTLMGETQCRTVSADGCIFMRPLMAERTQTGCVRYSYLDMGSRSPRPHRCQPHLALKQAPATASRQALLRLRPSFTSTRQNHYAYAQLGPTCAEEIRTGAENGAEMGAFNRLTQPQREANIRAGLKNYLRWGLSAGLIPAT